MWLDKKILVATDFSETAMRAADVGLELAQTFHQPLVLLHVWGAPGPAYRGIDLVPTADFAHSVEAAAREALNEEAGRLAKKGITVTSLLRTGIAWEQILDAAKMVDAGLIVIATHGRRGLPRAVLGSVAERVERLLVSPPRLLGDAPSAGVERSFCTSVGRSRQSTAMVEPIECWNAACSCRWAKGVNQWPTSPSTRLPKQPSPRDGIRSRHFATSCAGTRSARSRRWERSTALRSSTPPSK